MALQKLINFPITTNFRFVCSELPLLSEVAQDITIPPVTLNPAEVFTRTGDYGQPGEKLSFTELDIGFSMDEYFDVYAEVFSWMNRMAGMPELQSVKESERGILFADCEIILLDNAMRETRRFIFHDSWPTTMGALPLDVAGEASTMKGIVTFQYLAMEIRPDTKNLSELGDLRYSH